MVHAQIHIQGYNRYAVVNEGAGNSPVLLNSRSQQRFAFLMGHHAAQYKRHRGVEMLHELTGYLLQHNAHVYTCTIKSTQR